MALDDPYTVLSASGPAGIPEYHVARVPFDVVSRAPLSHDDAVALCERLNREASSSPTVPPSGGSE